MTDGVESRYLRALMARTQIERLRADNERLRSAGASLANVAFNWAQIPGYTLTSRDAELLDKLRRAWDAAIEASRRSRDDEPH